MRNIAFGFTLALVFSLPWENAFNVGSLGTLSRAVGMAATGVWMLSVVLTHWLRKPHPFHIVAVLFIMWNILSIFWSIDVEMTMIRAKTYAQLVILLWLLWDMTTTPNALRWVLQAYILGAFVSVGSTISNYLAGQEAYLYSGGRFVATGFDTNDLGLIIALGIAPAWYLALSEYKGKMARLFQIVNFAYIPAAFITIQLTASRGSMMSSVPALLFIFASSRKLHPAVRWLAFFAVIGILISAQQLLPASTIERLGTVTDSISSGDFGGRVALWKYAIFVFAQQPFVGVGSGAIGSVIGAFAHNVYVSVLSETGLIGFAIFAMMLGIVINQALRQPKMSRWLCLSLLAVWAVGIIGLSWEFRKPTWLVLSLIVISANLIEEPVPGEKRVSAPATVLESV